MVKPVTPKKATKNKKDAIPNAVIRVFNHLIEKHLSNGVAVVPQKEAVKLIVYELQISEQEVFDQGHLDIEDIFEDAGWNVYYDKPGYNEKYEPTFIFKEE